MTDRSASLVEVTELFYEAAISPERWSEASARLASLFDADLAGIMLTPADRFGALSHSAISMFGVPKEANGVYVAEFAQHDVLTIAASRADGRTVRGWDVIEPDSFERHVFWNEFSRPFTGAWQGMAVRPSGQEGVVLLSRAKGKEEFTRLEEQQFLSLANAAGRALRLANRVQGDGLGTIAFDALTLAALIVSPSGQLLHANPAASRLLASRGIRLSREGSALPGLRSRDRLLQLARTGKDGGFREVSPDGKGALIFQLSPLPESLAPVGMPLRIDRAVLVTIRPASPGTASPGLFAEVFGLTEAEAAVAALLVEGLTAPQVAQRRNVGQETIRSQIATLMVKADAANLRDLVRRLDKLSSA
jgi:DNA-binding CsgD family transcriptional regulator